MLKALVITPNAKTTEVGDVIAIARAEARKRERMHQNPPIRALSFIPELHIFVAIYEVQETQMIKVTKSDG